MQLNKQTDYAFRVLMYLGTAPEGKRCTVHEISEAFGISANNLAKIVNQFSHLGLITTIRGRNGGVHINPETMDYPLGKLALHFEPDTELAGCETGECALTSECSLRSILASARGAMVNTLDQYSVRDLLVKKDWLEQVLSLDP